VTSDRLRKVEIFQGLTDEDLKVIAPFCLEESISEGITLCAEGTRADRLFILEEGKVAVNLKRGVRFIIQTPGKILGWSFLVPPNRYTASVVTMAPCKLILIKSPDFYELIHKEIKLGLKIMDNLSQVVAGRLRSFVDYY
jgi:CRP/FNR family transcriptional regulator, cyclic AMP receptor protein